MFFYINISLTEVKYVRRRNSHFIKKKIKKITCHRKTTSFMYKKTKGMILTFSENLDVVLNELIEF